LSGCPTLCHHTPKNLPDPELDGSAPLATDFPLGKTQPGASLDNWPGRVMDGCTEPLADGVPDLREAGAV
jgi:hypothetical protein